MSNSTASKTPRDEGGVTENPAPRGRPKLEEGDFPEFTRSDSDNRSRMESVQVQYDKIRWERTDEESDKIKGHIPTPLQVQKATRKTQDPLDEQRIDINSTMKRVDFLTETISDLESSQKELDEDMAELSDKISRVAAVEKELKDFEAEISERVTQLENQIKDMEQTGQKAEMGVTDSYPSFAAFSLRAAITAVLFVVLFGTFYSQGVIGGVVFGALLALLTVLAMASAATWYKLK